MSKKTVLSLFLLAAFMNLFFINSRAETIHNPVVETDNSMDSKQKVTWDCVYFGSYPQTEIIGTEQYSALSKKLLEAGDYQVAPAIYQALEDAPEEDWSSTGDMVLGGEKYRRMKVTDTFRRSIFPKMEYFYQWEEDTYHYFRYDPIKWRVLQVEGSEVLLLADKALDMHSFSKDYRNDLWEKSLARSYLNGYGPDENSDKADYTSPNKNFIETAFTSEEQGQIIVSRLENKANPQYTIADGNDTEDKVFLLSMTEASEKAYGFASEFKSRDEGKKGLSTTYAKAMGVVSNINTKTADWDLRTSGYQVTEQSISISQISVRGEGSVTGPSCVLRPAIRLPLSACQYAGTVQSQDMICNHSWGEWDCSWRGGGIDYEGCIAYDAPFTRRCGICNAEDLKHETFGSHSWGDWHVLVASTPWATGIKGRSCKRCIDGYEEKVIPKRKMTANEKKAYNVTKNFFKYAKTYNIKKMNACFASSQPASFFRDNKYMASYCRKYNKKKLKISPVDIVVKGKKATVTLKVTYPNAYKPLLKTCEAMNWNGYSYHNKKGKAKMKAFVKRYTKAYGVGKQTKTIKVNLKKTKKKGWKLSSPTTAMKNAINCNYRTAFKDAK